MTAKELFNAALLRPTHERAAFVREAAADNDGLAAEVLSLLSFHDDAPEPPPGSVIAHPRQVGPYRIIQTLGEGGMGVVYHAKQETPIERDVAIKIVKPGMDSKAVLHRFEAERQALALMEHPGIAKVFEAGVTDEGRPYFAMEYVRGDRITTFCDTRRLTLHQRLKLFVQLCEAVQHAHQKGVIHRDLKPSNVLVTQEGEIARPVVIDFGVAKALDTHRMDETHFTAHGQVIGTPAYMSPEQATSSGRNVDTRTDVYSLGVLLYELLSGVQPFESDTFREAGLPDIERLLREVVPPRPSARFARLREGAVQVASHRRTDPKRMVQALRGDPDCVVMKCLEKDRDNRYETANALLLDVRRYLDHQPVVASPPTASYRLRKFLQRNKLPVAAAAATFLALAAGLLGMGYGLFQARQQQAIAQERLADAMTARRASDAVVAFIVDAFSELDPEAGPGPNIPVHEFMDLAANKLAGKFTDHPVIRYRLLSHFGHSYALLGYPQKAEILLREAMQIGVDEFGAEDARTLRAITDLVVALNDQREHVEAERIGRRAVDVHRRTLGPEHPDTLKMAVNLAIALDGKGDYEGAARRYAAALPALLGPMLSKSQADGNTDANELCDVVLMASHETLLAAGPGTLTVLNNLATLLYRQGQYTRSERLFRKLVTVYREDQRLDDPDALAAMANLAAVMYTQGENVEAERLCREALPLMRECLPEGHGYILKVLNNLANIRNDLGDFVEAERILQNLVEVKRTKFGEDAPTTLASLDGLASARERLGNYAEAERIHRTVLEKRRRTLGSEHPSALESMHHLARALFLQGKFREAEALCTPAIETRQRILSDKHPDTIRSMVLGAKLHLAMARHSQAADSARRALMLVADAVSPEHPLVSVCQATYGRALLALGRSEEAEPLLRSAYPLLSASAATMQDADDAARALAELYEAKHNMKPEAGYEEQAAKWRRKAASAGRQ